MSEDTLLQTAQFWAESSCFDESTRHKAQALIDTKDRAQLEEHFGKILEFGTGGLRGVMGVGINRMNTYTVRLVTEGLAVYMEQHDASSGGVVIGYDSRHNSLAFAKTTAEVLAGHGIQAFLFESIAPTPLVSCELLRRSATAGIIITASHNPPAYNGYKVYWKNGGQVIPPEDQGIIDEVRNVSSIDSIPFLAFDEGVEKGLIHWVGKEADAYYWEQVEPLLLGSKDHNVSCGVIYTPLHGTGGRMVPELLRKRGFCVQEVAEQMLPDGDFSTVLSPNPEDVNAFGLAQDLSESLSMDHFEEEESEEEADFEEVASTVENTFELILANDPDADRLGVMVRDTHRNWKWLTGNQIGVLLLDFHLKQLKRSNKLPQNGVYVASIVSSPMGKAIAESYGLETRETLTGFKWIWDAALKVEAEGKSFFFGMEESHGYLRGKHSGDKDGIWAAIAFAEMTALFVAEGSSPFQHLESLSAQFGTHLDTLVNQDFLGLGGQESMNALMRNFRENPPQSLGSSRVIRITDLMNDSVYSPDDSQKSTGPGLPSSNVLIFETENDSRMILRPSGTEPKIKYYINLKGADEATLNSRLAAIKKDLE